MAKIEAVNVFGPNVADLMFCFKLRNFHISNEKLLNGFKFSASEETTKGL